MTYHASPTGSPPPPPGPRPEDDRAPGATPYQRLPPLDLTGRSAPPPLPAPTYHRRHRGLRLAGLAFVGLLVAAGAVSTVPEMVRDADEQVFAVPEGAVELDLRGDAGEVVVRGVAAGQPTQIVAEKHWSFREPTATVETDGGVMSAALDCPPVAFGQCYADWLVTVPAGTKVVLRTSVGDVDVAGMTGAVTVNGSVGDVRVTGTPSSLDVTTSVGEVSAVLEEPAESVRLRSSVGDIDLRLPQGFSYDVRTSSPLDPGAVQVETSDRSPYEVDVSTSVGTVLVSDG